MPDLSHQVFRRQSTTDQSGNTCQTVWKVVLTGGPCAGKTTILHTIANRFTNHGIKVFTVPEVATQLINGGVSWNGISEEQAFGYQTALLEMQLQQEKAFCDIAALHGGPCLIVCDRGTMDGKAYCSESSWQRILDRLGLNNQMIRDTQYDAIFHLVTAADGAEEFYTTGNNVARWETKEQAREQDQRTLSVYLGHPHLHIIDNSTSFNKKIERVMDKLSAMVGVQVGGSSTYRRFLVTNPPEDLPVPHVRSDIDILMLQGSSMKDESRLLLRGDRDAHLWTYVHQKLHRVQDKPVVTEYVLDRTSFQAMADNIDKDLQPIHKRNVSFVYGKCYFEMGTFMNTAYAGTTLLYCEATEAEIDLPPFLTISCEVTHDQEFSALVIAQTHCDSRRLFTPDPPSPAGSPTIRTS
mmetsp:Transcript_136743/g.237457  ORF Transcript_136743/g.237457 Transcript_136743/m.237457 type:complete len:410 (-) Transcript_136743:233-1462(-)